MNYRMYQGVIRNLRESWILLSGMRRRVVRTLVNIRIVLSHTGGTCMRIETWNLIFRHFSVSMQQVAPTVIDTYTRWPWLPKTISSVGTATRYGPGGLGIESLWGGEIFRSSPDGPWDPPSLLYNGYRLSFPGVKRPGRGVDHPPPSSAEVNERVELYLYSLSGPSWPVTGWTFVNTLFSALRFGAFTVKGVRNASAHLPTTLQV